MNSRFALSLAAVLVAALAFTQAHAKEYHVSVNGNDANDGSPAAMLQTISAAAQKAQPGDTITVHAGVYRERITPPRGGTSDDMRIVYQAAPGEKVVITGSERVNGWEKVENDTWKAVVPNAVFGEYNPYSDPIHGDWFDPKGRVHHTGAVYLNGHWLIEAAKLEEVLKPAETDPLWFAEVGEENTTIWAQFKGIDPNTRLVEINVRRAVFYPGKPFVNYITVRGFTMQHAATQWAPPTAEQIGLIGTRWSKGWIIEDNDIAYSVCTGVTLGKYGDQFDNTSQDTAEGYVDTINRALENGWNKGTIGGHVVRNNHISHCEQAGIVGSMGAIFSTVTGNTIHDCHVRRLFNGAEMSGIKFHGAIDTLIADNHIYRCVMGLWLDWMSQGTRVSHNLFHGNLHQDLFVEVNHGPFLVDNNLFLSPTALTSMSQGGAYVHNLFAGNMNLTRYSARKTPFHKPHSTEVADLHDNPRGDDRYYNNIFAGSKGLEGYNEAPLPVFMAGNVYLNGATPPDAEEAPLVKPEYDPGVRLTQRDDAWYLELATDPAWVNERNRNLVTTDLLGKARIPNLHYENRDGSPVRIATDYFNNQRDETSPAPGPFARSQSNTQSIKVWPVGNRAR